MAITDVMAGRDHVPGLAARLKAAREAAGLSQVDAARLSGVHAVSIARFETEVRMPSVASLYKLARAYGVNICDLLPGGNPPPPDPPRKGRKP